MEAGAGEAVEALEHAASNLRSSDRDIFVSVSWISASSKHNCFLHSCHAMSIELDLLIDSFIILHTHFKLHLLKLFCVLFLSKDNDFTVFACRQSWIVNGGIAFLGSKVEEKKRETDSDTTRYEKWRDPEAPTNLCCAGPHRALFSTS